MTENWYLNPIIALHDLRYALRRINPYFQIRFALQFSPFSRYHRISILLSNEYCCLNVKRRWRDQYQRCKSNVDDPRYPRLQNCERLRNTRFHAKHVKSWRRLLTHVYTTVTRRRARAPSFLPTFFSACLKLRDRTHTRQRCPVCAIFSFLCRTRNTASFHDRLSRIFICGR